MAEDHGHSLGSVHTSGGEWAGAHVRHELGHLGAVHVVVSPANVLVGGWLLPRHEEKGVGWLVGGRRDGLGILNEGGDKTRSLHIYGTACLVPAVYFDPF